jgi:stage II sporulation protein AA (anti-sigma F factor antagonist)
MDINYEFKNGTLTCYLSGDIDHHNAKFFREGLDELIDECHGIRLLIVDFSKVSFMDSSGVGIILGRYKKLKELGANLNVSNANPYIKRIFTLCAIDKLVGIN